MTEVYLGKPPVHVEAWMKENFKTEKWVPAVYTDQWSFSDSEYGYHRVSLDDMTGTRSDVSGWIWAMDGVLGI